MTAVQATMRRNFSRLSKRSKVIVLGYLMMVVVFLGMFGRTSYLRRTSADFPVNPRRPIEITYSSFMDLVEQDSKTSKDGTTVVPTLDKVKIAPDRISFRLSKPDPTQPDAPKKYLMAYTRKIPAPPETLQYLRRHKLDFTAASNSRNLLLIYGFRSLLFSLYGLFLYRMYQTMRGQGGAGGGGSGGDVPGKLLKESERPLASFVDIQGIDSAKNEVMELVDTLRNPEKYAILGARAPTGLLLEGPPGTGKVCFV